MKIENNNFTRNIREKSTIRKVNNLIGRKLLLSQSKHLLA